MTQSYARNLPVVVFSLKTRGYSLNVRAVRHPYLLLPFRSGFVQALSHEVCGLNETDQKS